MNEWEWLEQVRETLAEIESRSHKLARCICAELIDEEQVWEDLEALADLLLSLINDTRASRVKPGKMV